MNYPNHSLSHLKHMENNMPEIAFDRFYRYDDLTRLVHAFAEEYPSLMRVESIGKSHEVRAKVTLSGSRDARMAAILPVSVQRPRHNTPFARYQMAPYRLRYVVDMSYWRMYPPG